MQDCGAERMAIQYAQAIIMNSSNVNAAEKVLDDVLPTTPKIFFETIGADMANFLASLDSTATILLGGAFGRYALGATKFGAALPRLSPKLKWVTPGIPIISIGADLTWKMRIATTAVNLGWEYTKFNLVLRGAMLLSHDEDWLNAVSLTTLFGASAMGAALATGYARITQAVLGSDVESAIMANTVPTSPAAQEALKAVQGRHTALSGEHLAASGPISTLRLQGPIPKGMKVIRDRLEFLRELGSDVAQLRGHIERLSTQIRAAFERIAHLQMTGISVNAGSLNRLTIGFAKLAQSTSTTRAEMAKRWRDMGRLARDVEDFAKRLSRPARNPTSVPNPGEQSAKRHPQQRRPRRGGPQTSLPPTGGNAKRDPKSLSRQRPTADAPENGTGPAQPTAVPVPAQITMDDLGRLSSGRFQVGERGPIGKIIEAWYNRVAGTGHKERLIQALQALTTSEMGGWKQLAGGSTLFQFRIGKMRLIVQRTNGHFTLVEFNTRGDVRVGPRGKSRER